LERQIPEKGVPLDQQIPDPKTPTDPCRQKRKQKSSPTAARRWTSKGWRARWVHKDAAILLIQADILTGWACLWVLWWSSCHLKHWSWRTSKQDSSVKGGFEGDCKAKRCYLKSRRKVWDDKREKRNTRKVVCWCRWGAGWKIWYSSHSLCWKVQKGIRRGQTRAL